MATATVISSDMPEVSIVDNHVNNKSNYMLTEAQGWASKLREDLTSLVTGLPVSDDCFNAPRRKHKDARSAELAALIAPLLFPAPKDSLSPIIRYEEAIVQLRARIKLQRKEAIENATVTHASESWIRRILDQGPWDQDHDPVSLDGPPALPMPVTISDADSLGAFLEHLKMDGGLKQSVGKLLKEPYYGTDMLEFEKGVLYADHRMDLCKK